MMSVNILWNVLFWSLLIFLGAMFLKRRLDRTTSKKDKITNTIRVIKESPPVSKNINPLIKKNTTISRKVDLIALIYLAVSTFLLYGWIGSFLGETSSYIFTTFMTFFSVYYYVYLDDFLNIYKKIKFNGENLRIYNAKQWLIRFSTSLLYAVIICSVLLGSWVYLDQLLASKLQALEKATQATIAANNLKHKSELRTLKVKHKKDIARERSKNKRKVAQVKMKERSKRWFASIPIIGTVLVLWSGKDEYDEYEAWEAENPTGTIENYTKYKTELLIGD